MLGIMLVDINALAQTVDKIIRLAFADEMQRNRKLIKGKRLNTIKKMTQGFVLEVALLVNDTTLFV